ncbi:MAG: transposase 32 family protein [Candidatus Rokubacteria bacterium CSP1-6]|nr:MAG: transposase 32 family protein [Candidatus Rokubacteria bacterium CSP1-6]
MALARPAYRPRDAERGVLHIVVRTHLDTFLREAARCAKGGGLPQFVEQQFRGRGFCPSCGGRRMTERAARLVDGVLPHVPVRQCRVVGQAVADRDEALDHPGNRHGH